MKVVKAHPGRPLKFGRPARPVTLTLPEDIIEALSSLADDLGQAVVNVSQPFIGRAAPRPDAELTNYGQSAVIVVRPMTALERIAGVKLVPIPDGRALISLDHEMTVFEFELKLGDLLDDETCELAARERKALDAIRELLKLGRNTRGVDVERRSIMVLQSAQGRRITAFLRSRGKERDAIRKGARVREQSQRG